jgi:hypothetical protein
LPPLLATNAAHQTKTPPAMIPHGDRTNLMPGLVRARSATSVSEVVNIHVRTKGQAVIAPAGPGPAIRQTDTIH